MSALRATEFRLGWFAEPIYVTGNYPQTMVDQVADKTSESTSRLPVLSTEDQMLIRGSLYLHDT